MTDRRAVVVEWLRSIDFVPADPDNDAGLEPVAEELLALLDQLEAVVEAGRRHGDDPMTHYRTRPA